MVQIIGWLLCVYLIIKGFELLAMQTISETGRMLAVIGAVIAFVAAPVFFFMLNAQADSGSNSLSRSQSYSECLSEADTLEEMNRCRP